jgi:hypothetical protein
MPGSFIMSGKDTLCRGPAFAGIFICGRPDDIVFRLFTLSLSALDRAEPGRPRGLKAEWADIIEVALKNYI